MVYTEYISLWRGEAGEIKKKVFFVQNLSLAEMQGREVEEVLYRIYQSRRGQAGEVDTL